MRDVTRVVDLGTGGQENDVMHGRAHVVVTSRANDKTVEGYTNNDGIVNLNIKALAEDPDGVGADNLPH